MQKPWKWSTPTLRFRDRSLAEAAECCRAAGLAGLEGHRETYENHSVPELEAEARALRDAGLEMETFHLPFQAEDDLSAFYESNRRVAVARARRWMERAARLGARIGIAHPCNGRSGVRAEGLDPYLAALDRSLRELLPAAEPLGLDLAFENMPPNPHGRFGSLPEHFVRIRKAFGHPRLKFCLDTGHALIAARHRALDFFPAMGPDLAAFHLQDTAGDRDLHLAPGRGRIDWSPIFRNMAKRKYRGIACLEAPPFDFGPDFSPDAWRRMIDETDALVSRALQDGPPADERRRRSD